MARRKEPSIPDALLDQLLSGVDPKTAFDPGGLLDGLKKAFAERAGQSRIAGEAFAQIGGEGVDDRLSRLARPVCRGLQPALDIFAHRLAVGARRPGDRRYRKALPM